MMEVQPVNYGKEVEFLINKTSEPVDKVISLIHKLGVWAEEVSQRLDLGDHVMQPAREIIRESQYLRGICEGYRHSLVVEFNRFMQQEVNNAIIETRKREKENQSRLTEPVLEPTDDTQETDEEEENSSVRKQRKRKDSDDSSTR